MRTFVRSLGIMAAVAATTGAGLHLLGLGPWAEPPQLAVSGFLALVIGVGITASFDDTSSGAGAHPRVRLSYVSALAALLVLGPIAMTLVAVVAVAAGLLAGPPRAHPVRRALLELAGAVAATQAAGVAHTTLGGTQFPLAWPWQGLPITAAVLTYCAIGSAVADALVPLVTRSQTVAGWPRRLLRGCPGHVIGAGIAVAFTEVIGHQAWALLPVAAVPTYFAWRAYAAHLDQLDRENWHTHLTDSLDHGASIVDMNGRVTLWNDALARLLDCPCPQALGQYHVDAVPVLARSELPEAVREALRSRKPRTLAHLRLPSSSGTRTLHVTILPHVGGLLLLWRDITAQIQGEEDIRQSAERFALVAEGANDGSWELDERTQALYVSARWRALLGLPAVSGSGTCEDWFGRVHTDDIAGLKQALNAHDADDVDHVAHEFRIRHEDGTYRRVLCRSAAVRDGGRRISRIAGSLTDITDNVIARERLLRAGLYDSLTGLWNRAAFVDALGQRLSDFRERRGGRFATLYLDLDRFKVVNDSLGHLVGDDLLVATSRRLETCLRPGDAIARLGGDEFAILLQELGDETQANVIALRIQEALSKPFSVGGRDVVTSASIGIAFSRADYTNPEEIMRDADTAMYHAKAHGKARHELFDADMHARALDRLGLEGDLRHAVAHKGFGLHYQPIVSLGSRMCIGFEALVRWERNGKRISPNDFIPLAEELGLIEELGAWVLQEACRTFAAWQRRFPECELDCITVNVSTRQLLQQGFGHLVEQTVRAAGMKPGDLRLEITETALMDAPQLVAQVLKELRAFGVKIYLDDFGTGFSSLSHLHKLPVDALKIDHSFVRGLLLDDRPAIVESILALARTLHTGVVAEGVEDERQATKLERLGCRQAQGFYFSPALPTAQVEQLLIAGQPLGGARVGHPAVVTSIAPVRSIAV